MQLAENGSNIVSINFVTNEFEFNRSEYNCTMTIIDYTGTTVLTYTLHPKSTNQIVCGAFVNKYYYAKIPGYDTIYLHDGFSIDSSSWNDLAVSVVRSGSGTAPYTILQTNSIGIAGTIVSETNSVQITIDADFPIFAMGSSTSSDGYGGTYVRFANTDFTTYETELVGGDDTHANLAINYYDIANSIPNNKVWSIKNYFKANGVIAHTKGYDFRILPTAKIAMYVTDQVEGDASPNAHIVISEYPCMVKAYNAPDSAYAISTSIDADYWWGEWQDPQVGVTYIGYGSTNIPIFTSQEDAQRYFNGELTIADAINGGDTTIRTSTIGNELTSSDIPTISLSASGVGVNVYALSEAQIKDIMSNYLYTTDPNTQTTIGDALWLWGNNPIDFMVDCYYIPFNITSFYTTINANLKFGTYQFTGTSFPAVKETNGNRLTLFTTTFEGVYGDWRDFTQFNYDLYLPFYGFYSLDVYKYLNHTVKCEMMFDLTTHNLRYYLYCDGIITDRIDASVGISIPIMATDMVNKAKHDRDIRYGVLNDAISAGASIGMGVTSADFGGLATGIVSGVGHIINGVKQYQELNTQASQSVVGGFSSAMNTYDIMYAYLRITERQAVIPANVNNIYNYPSYYMGALSNLHGYCEIEDVQLLSNATEEEQEEIKGLLKGGVIF